MQVKILGLDETPPDNVIFPQQTHSCNISEVVSGEENLSECDGVWSLDSRAIPLGIKTADCAPIAFFDSKKYGVLHCGWRGLVGGIIENMLSIFDSPETKIFVGPMLPLFEIQKDFCFEAIKKKFGDQFFIEQEKQILFNFESALASLLPPQTQWDGRSTSNEKDLASWRRDQNSERNVMVIYT